ncbi:MAG: hypothetical protein QOD44_3342 [Solirubrobacteraceae bacterium]|nr:hypothetical protein [Solirubrobacteraceae bacterium]
MPPDAHASTATRPLPLGVNLAGYFGATVGLAEAVRQIAGALEAAGVAVAPVELVHSAAPRSAVAPGAAAVATPAPVHPVTVVCVSPEGMAAARSQQPAAFDGPRVVGMWWWEVLAFPGRFARAFDGVDEVWVGSRFVADVLGAVAPVPVVRMPLPVAAPRPAAVGREALGLPPGFLFGFVFDYASVAGRKNPLGLIEAFRRAFPEGGGDQPSLVLKTLGGDRHPADHAAVLTAAAGHPRTHVIDRHVSSEEKDALIGHLDCYVSLHRSEGFGLTMAEAALLGTPVIATDYGGPRDFLTPFNSFPVDNRVVPIGPGHDPYPADGEWAEPDLDHAAALMRRVVAEPGEARARSERARADVEREHAPAAAGRAMADRLARMLGAPRTQAGRLEAVDLAEAERRVRTGPGVAAAGLRGSARAALLRALRPYTVHQRLVDEEILRALRTLDERVRAVAAGQATLAVELRRLREALPEDADDDGSRSLRDGGHVPPSPRS